MGAHSFSSVPRGGILVLTFLKEPVLVDLLLKAPSFPPEESQPQHSFNKESHFTLAEISRCGKNLTWRGQFPKGVSYLALEAFLRNVWAGLRGGDEKGSGKSCARDAQRGKDHVETDTAALVSSALELVLLSSWELGATVLSSVESDVAVFATGVSSGDEILDVV